MNLINTFNTWSERVFVFCGMKVAIIHHGGMGSKSQGLAQTFWVTPEI